MEQARFRDQEIDYLRSQRDSTGKRLFADDFLGWLAENGNFKQITWRYPRGAGGAPQHALDGGRRSAGHGSDPRDVVVGPSQLSDADCHQSGPHGRKRARAPRVGTGLRRAQGGATPGTRRAGRRHQLYLNVAVSRALGLPPKGTHAHSLVQLFMALGLGELAAFQAYADLYPDDCLLLVDTVKAFQSGVPHAIQVFETLRQKGHQPAGIRLDSGDLAYLSIQAAKMLNEAGFPDTSIVLSGDLDELVIWQIATQIGKEARAMG